MRTTTLEACIHSIEGWYRLAADAGMAMQIETHRDRMKTDLFFTRQLLDHLPDLRLTADLSHDLPHELSHDLEGRKCPWPVSEENHALIHRILDNA